MTEHKLKEVTPEEFNKMLKDEVTDFSNLILNGFSFEDSWMESDDIWMDNDAISLNFQGSTLINMDMNLGPLIHFDFRNATIEDCSFAGGCYKDCDFTNATLKYVEFYLGGHEQAEFGTMKFTDATIRGVMFNDGNGTLDLTGATVIDSTIMYCNLENLILDHATLSQDTIIDSCKITRMSHFDTEFNDTEVIDVIVRNATDYEFVDSVEELVDASQRISAKANNITLTEDDLKFAAELKQEELSQ